MDDWPRSKTRTKLFAVAGVGAVLVQGAVTVFNLLGSHSRFIADSLGVLVVAASVLIAIWCATKNRDPRVLFLSAFLSLGITLRAIGLATFSYFTPPVPPVVPSVGARLVLVAGYAALAVGLLGSAIGLGRRVNVRIPATLSVAAGLFVAFVLAFAAFGPVPGAENVFTSRDLFAGAIFTADSLLFAVSAFVTLSLLQISGGTMSRAWLWITVGLLLATMGDTALPMLEPADAPHYVSLMWGAGYALAAVGALLSLDINEWHLRRHEAIPIVEAFSAPRVPEG
jgi:hypothetical protein